MSNTTIGKANLQADDNGMITLQCDRCKSRFKMNCGYLNDELAGDVCCPICGISAELNTFYPEEVAEAAKEIALAHAEKLIASSFKGLNTKFIKVKTTPQRKVDANRAFKDKDYDMEIVQSICCNKDFALKQIDFNSGYYCPYCGRIVK